MAQIQMIEGKKVITLKEVLDAYGKEDSQLENPIMILIEGGIVQKVFNQRDRHVVIIDYDPVGEEDFVITEHKGIRPDCPKCSGKRFITHYYDHATKWKREGCPVCNPKGRLFHKEY